MADLAESDVKILNNKPLFKKGDNLIGNTRKSRFLKDIKFQIAKFRRCEEPSDNFDCAHCTGYIILTTYGMKYHDIYEDFVKGGK